MDEASDAGRRARIPPCLELLALCGWLSAGFGLLWWFEPALSLEPPPRAMGPGDRTCGSSRLRLYRARAMGVERLESGAHARGGDRVQLGYVARGAEGRPPYGAILSIDGWGIVTRHLPRIGTEAVVLELQREVLLDHAFQLDDAPSFERFWLVTSDKPFSLERVEEAMREGQPLPMHTEQFELVKP